MVECVNCGASLVGAYCHACGQKRFDEGDRRFSHLLRDFFESATDLDSRVWRSVRALLFQPGRLTREYFLGRRARWLSPATLFLLVNLLYFLAPLHGGDFSLQFAQQVSGRVRALAADPDHHYSPEQLAGSGQAHSHLTEAWIERRVHARDAAARVASGGRSGYDYRDYRLEYDARADEVSKALVILHLPPVALVLALVLARRRLYYAEHFVFVLHYFAFALAALQMVIQAQALAQTVLPAWAPGGHALDWFMRVLLCGYGVLAARRAYGLGWPGAIAVAAAMLAAIITFNLYVYRAIQFAVTFALT